VRIETPAYVIVGGGRWAGIVRDVLTKQGRTIRCVTGVRKRIAESEQGYRDRVSEALAGGQIAWMCVPPCAERELLIDSAVKVGLHVIVEKPWMRSPLDTEPLARMAEERGVLVGVHFQYCFLDAVRELRTALGGIEGLRFRGRFTLSRPDRLQIPAIHNLGSHLLAVREYVASHSEVEDIRCGYEMEDERWVALDAAAGLTRTVELRTEEPIIQRYIEAFEDSMAVARFPFDLRFAARVFSACGGMAASNFE
jgi:predicted dehydrogenase